MPVEELSDGGSVEAGIQWRKPGESQYANPWKSSHHYAVAVAPGGQVWVLQPQPTPDQDPNQQVVFGPYASIEETVPVVASWYGATVDKYDVRSSKYEPLSP